VAVIWACDHNNAAPPNVDLITHDIRSIRSERRVIIRLPWIINHGRIDAFFYLRRCTNGIPKLVIRCHMQKATGWVSARTIGGNKVPELVIGYVARPKHERRPVRAARVLDLNNKLRWGWRTKTRVGAYAGAAICEDDTVTIELKSVEHWLYKSALIKQFERIFGYGCSFLRARRMNHHTRPDTYDLLTRMKNDLVEVIDFFNDDRMRRCAVVKVYSWARPLPWRAVIQAFASGEWLSYLITLYVEWRGYLDNEGCARALNKGRKVGVHGSRP
jgi:hypothetical protein